MKRPTNDRSNHKRSNNHTGTKQRLKKVSKTNDLEQYYADGMIEEISQSKPDLNEEGLIISNKVRNELIESNEDDEEQEEIINLEDEGSKAKLNTGNMDKISDILVNMIFKNKVNPKNAFDVPLPSVKQLTDFHHTDGDTAWKKLSQTLDAGAKIYGFRVDSVHNEAYKILGGLNRADLREEQKEQNKDKDAVNEDEEEEIGHISRKVKKDNDGEGTLEKNISNIDTNKYDLEFDIDPLFQKTSAKFDEGGAKGLLLNNISVNGDMHLMFDDDTYESKNKAIGSAVGVAKKPPLQRKFFSHLESKKDFEDLYNSKLCPELTIFKTTYLKDSKYFSLDYMARDQKETEALMKDIESKDNTMLRFENIEVEENKIIDELNHIIDNNEPEQPNIDELPNANDYGKEDNNNIDMGVNDVYALPNIEVLAPIELDKESEIKELNFSNIDEKLASIGFGQSLDHLIPDNKTWMGPESWKLSQPTKSKFLVSDKANNQSHNEKETKKSKKDTEKLIQFDLSIKEKLSTIFGITPTSSKKKNKSSSSEESSSSPGSKNAFTLPQDLHIKPSRLTNLFLRPIELSEITRIGGSRGGNINGDKSKEYNENGEYQNEHQIQNENGDEFEDLVIINGDDGHLVENDPLSAEYQNNFDNIFQSKQSKANEDKRLSVNIKVLKQSMWNMISSRVEAIDLPEEDKTTISNSSDKMSLEASVKNDLTATTRFTQICHKIPDIMGINKGKSLSIHSCFVTALHLANEKGLRFCKDGEDFLIYKEQAC